MNIKNITIILLRALLIGLLVGSSLWLVGQSSYQAFMVGAWITLCVIYVQEIQREQKRKGLAIFGAVGIIIFHFLAGVVTAFGYQTDYRLLFLFLFAWFGGFGVAYFINQSRFKIALYSVIAVGVLVYAATSLSRCSFVPCQPTTWAEQLSFIQNIQAEYGPDWQVKRIVADPASRNIFWFTDQPNLQVLVLLTNEVSDASQTEVINDIVSFSYNDIDPERTLDLYDPIAHTNIALPAAEIASLVGIQLSPRDAFNVTQNAGEQFLGRTPKFYEVDIRLEFGEEIPVEFGVEPVWSVTYSELQMSKELQLWVSAVTGNILRTEEVLR